MKKFYFLILFMCLAIGNAWADNGFELLGIKPNVASGSTGSWPASSLVSGATGTITYTPNTKTLVFDNVQITSASHGKKVVYNKSVDGLTIVFKGTCIFFSNDNILRYEMATILDGSASTKVEMHVMSKSIGDDKETFYSNNEYNTGTHDPYASLEIKNFPYLRLTAQGDYCISHTYGAVDIKDSHVLMESGKGTIHTNMYDENKRRQGGESQDGYNPSQQRVLRRALERRGCPLDRQQMECLIKDADPRCKRVCFRQLHLSGSHYC